MNDTIGISNMSPLCHFFFLISISPCFISFHNCTLSVLRFFWIWICNVLLCNAYLFPIFFVKSQCSFTRIPHLASFYEYVSEFVHLLNQLIAIYGASVRGSVFRGLFFILAGEFESVETSPGFAIFYGSLQSHW